jgi:outer membrane receptor protein involved in Fe transport
VQLEIPMNGQEAHVSGVELQAQFMLQFLPGKWRYLGIYSNYSYTQSEGQINKRYPANENTNIIYLGSDYDLLFQSDAVEIIPLPGQAPHASNLALFYDTGKFFIKIAANYNHEFLFKLGADPDLDEYYASNWRLDFNTYYQVTKSFQIFADVRNITNQPLKFYLGKPEANRVKLQEFYSFWARLGFRLNF